MGKGRARKASSRSRGANPTSGRATSPAPYGEGRTGGREPLLRLEPQADGPVGLTAGDHVRLLAELLQPTGPEMARRWLAILAMVPREEREDVVRAISKRVVETYGNSIHRAESFGLCAISPAVQREGYSEHVETTDVNRPPHGEIRGDRAAPSRGA